MAIFYFFLWVVFCAVGGIVGSNIARDGAFLGVFWGAVLFALVALTIERFSKKWAASFRHAQSKVNSPEGMRAAFLVLVAALLLIALCLVVIACVLVF